MCSDGDLRLVGGASESEGRVEEGVRGEGVNERAGIWEGCVEKHLFMWLPSPLENLQAEYVQGEESHGQP